MEVILITGLDGSGKSTVFKNLEKARTDQFNTLLVPEIDLSKLQSGSILYRSAEFVNKLGAEADNTGSVMMKSLSLFSSMLLFSRILGTMRTDLCTRVYCERHPLIDTQVYAKFYAGRLAPEARDQGLLGSIDKKYDSELQYILSHIPGDLIRNDLGNAEKIIDLIYTIFFLEKESDSERLGYLFSTDLPDRVYYLRAEVDILFERINEREKDLEAHESEEVLNSLDMAYKEVLGGLDIPVTEIDTKEINATDNLSKSLLENKKPGSRRILYIILGLICLVLAYIGVIMPGIPGTPFIILTAWFFIRSSDKLYMSLLKNRLFAKIIRNMKSGDRLSLKAKMLYIIPVWISAIVADIIFVNDWPGHIIVSVLITAYTIMVLMIKKINI